MKRIRRFGLAISAVVLATAAIGPAQALVRQSYDPDLVAYSYVYYADEAKTQELGTAFDRCVGSGNRVYVSRPYIPTPYYDQTPIYVCSGMGPYLPPDFS